MKRCSFRAWIPILPLPVWPLAWQCSLGQNTVVGSMTILLAVRGNIATRSMSGPPFALQLHRTTVWCGATKEEAHGFNKWQLGLRYLGRPHDPLHDVLPGGGAPHRRATQPAGRGERPGGLAGAGRVAWPGDARQL